MLSDVAELKTGYPFRGKLVASESSDVLAVQMKDVVQNSGINWHSCLPVNLPGKKQPDWLAPGDILFVVRGNTNYSVLVESLPEGDSQAVASPNFYVVRANTTKVLPEYLVWWLNQRACLRYFETNSEGSFTKNVRLSVLGAAPLVLPALEEQHSIVKLAANLRQQRLLLARQAEHTKLIEHAVANELWAAKHRTGSANR